MLDTPSPAPTDETRPPGRRQRLVRVIGTVLVVGCTGFVTLNLLVSGRWSMWLLFSLVPPLAFLVGPVSVSVLAASLPRRRRRVLLPVAVIGVLLGAPQSGLEIGAVVPSTGGTAGDPVRVVSWNTEYWHQTDDPAAFFRLLRDTDADVYLLQEYIHDVAGQVTPIDDLAGLRAAFPGYRIIVKAQQVTLSRLAVVDQPAIGDENILRVDVRTKDGTVLSTYNVHIPAQLDPTQRWLSAAFFRIMSDRGAERHAAYAALVGSARQDPNPGVVAGDFNTSASMGEIHSVTSLGTDAAAEGDTLYPMSWNDHQALPLWRLDWAFVRPGATVRDYRLLEADGMSDHRLQVVDLEMGRA